MYPKKLISNIIIKILQGIISSQNLLCEIKRVHDTNVSNERNYMHINACIHMNVAAEVCKTFCTFNIIIIHTLTIDKDQPILDYDRLYILLHGLIIPD